MKVKWADQKIRLRKKFSALTDQDLMYAEGQHAEMLIRLQIKLGKTKEQLQAIITAL